MSLDLYAKIEPLIGFYDEYEKLYDIYIEAISTYKPKKILDIGCGRGFMLEKLINLNYDVKGYTVLK